MYKPEAGQNIFDMALQMFGDATGVYDLAVINSLSVTDSIEPGTELNEPEFETNKSVVQYFTARNLKPATGNNQESGGIGYMGIDFNFIVS